MPIGSKKEITEVIPAGPEQDEALYWFDHRDETPENPGRGITMDADGAFTFDDGTPITSISEITQALKPGPHQELVIRWFIQEQDKKAQAQTQIAAQIATREARPTSHQDDQDDVLDGDEINRTRGDRWTVSGQAQYRFDTGPVAHTAIVALDHDREEFHARDTIYFGGSNQDRQRRHDAVTGEWRAELSPVVADVAVRHDRFSAFKDAKDANRRVVTLAAAYLYFVESEYARAVDKPDSPKKHGFRSHDRRILRNSIGEFLAHAQWFEDLYFTIKNRSDEP